MIYVYVYVTVPGKRDHLGNFFQNRVIATTGKSRLWATKCATYLVMKAKCSGVIAVSVHSFLSTAIA